MKEHIRLIVIILAVLLVTPACQLESGEKNDARTYYESLNLETSEDAVQTFAKAFQREDFMTVYLILDSNTQMRYRAKSAATMGWRHLVGEDTDESLRDGVIIQEILKTQSDPWYYFDQIMLYAAKEDDLLIDLRGDLDILRSEDSDSKTTDGRQAVDVIADVDGVNGEVLFRMVTDRDSRWRVYLVSAPDEGVDSWPYNR